MATAAFTTVVDRDDQPLTNTIWQDQIMDNLNQLGGAHKNLLTNGGLEVWQRGAGPFTTTVYTADRWQITSIAAGTVTVTQETTTVDGSVSSMKVVTTSGSTNNIIRNRSELPSGRGKTVSFSVRVHQNAASGVSAEVSVTSGNSSAATSATTSSFVTLSGSFTTASTDTFVDIILRFPVAGTYYIDNAMLVVGPAPAPFQPLHPQEDLARCQRYYEVLGGVSSSIFHRGYQAASTLAGTTLWYRVEKGGTPTITKNGTWGVTNCGQPAVGAPSPHSCNITTTVTALGDFSFSTNSTDDTVTVEYNP